MPMRFDRDVPLAQLLHGLPRARLGALLGQTLGPVWRIADPDGLLVWAEPVDPVADPVADRVADAVANAAPARPVFSAPLTVDLDVVGFLVVPDTCRAQADIAAHWLEILLASASRYRMAADLHLETVHADYAALQEKHAALQASEERYRALSAELEQRVSAQIGVIERARRHLFQSEKMASIGSLAAGMAHEINNPIGFIRSNLNTAMLYLRTLSAALTEMRRLSPQSADTVWRDADLGFVLDDFAGLITESVTGADRVTSIIGNLKTFSRIDCEASGAIDLNESVNATAAILADQLQNNIRLRLDLQPLPQVACEPGNMNQVLLALMQNARLAIGSADGNIGVSSRLTGERIQIAVSDDGCGIGADIIGRIFDPFFTTRDVGRGMGLGLTIASEIVAAHHGRLDVESTPGAGSTFTIVLPLPGCSLPSGERA